MQLSLLIVDTCENKKSHRDDVEIFSPIVDIRIASYAYVRYFGSSSVSKVNIMCISDYLKDGVLDALKVLKSSKKITDDSFVLQVIYEDLKNFKRAGDTQLFITGSVERSEEKDSSQTVCYELAEETRFEPQKKKSIELLVTCQTKSEKVDWFACPISNLRYIGPTPARKTEKMSYSYKIACIVYGTEDEMVNAISSIPKNSSRGNDRIKGLVCMRFTDVESLTLRIVKRQLAGKKGTIAWFG